MSDESGTDEPSEWQRRIEGEWHGRPCLFDATGRHVAYESVRRSSVFEDGVTTYYMDTQLEGVGPSDLRAQFELGAQFAFGVVDSDENRVYTGPDFYGTGQPYGRFVDAHYYSPGWQVDLRTWNQILPDGETQVYSSVVSQGWAVVGCFNGIYQVTFDHETNPETRDRIDLWIADETRRGPRPQVLPTKQAGRWTGELEVVTADQEPAGSTHVTMDHEPIDLRRARHTVTWDGELSRTYTFERYRDGNRLQYDGPDVFGNAISYGRSLFTWQHGTNEVWKIKGREVLMNESLDLAVVWQLARGDASTHFLNGLLTWQPA